MAAEVVKPDYSYQWSSGGAIVAPSNVKIQTGWTAEVPPFQWENWSQNRQDNAILHLFQKGISEWDAASNYYFTTSGVRSYVQGGDGNIYVAVSDSVGQNPITDTTQTYWRNALFSGHGQCRFDFVSSSQCILTPYGGQSLVINGVVQKIPSSGVTVSNAGLTQSLIYYCYAFMNAGTMTLEFSTTGHSKHTDGVEIKTGDPTRTLVGMVFANTGTPGVFVSAANSKCVLSYFNRKTMSSSFMATSGGPSFSNTSLSIVWSAASISFCSWGDEVTIASIAADGQLGTAGAGMGGVLFTDAVRNSNTSQWNSSGVSGVGSLICNMFASNLTEGFHINDFRNNVSSGTGTLVTIVNNCVTRG